MKQLANSSDESASPHRACRILVCEDHPLLALDLEDALRDRGAEVVGPFKTQDEACVALDASVEAAVLDVILADGQCVDLAVKLQSLGVPFIVVSVLRPEDVSELSSSAAAWFTKPADFDDVAAHAISLRR